MINEETWSYIRQHADDDVRQLALKGTKEVAVDLPMALQQIAARQTARRKLPSWVAVEGIVYPPHLNMEQCSSELTARYKAEWVVGDGYWVMEDSHTIPFVDLTGGLGVDFYWMAQANHQPPSPTTHHPSTRHPVYVEQNATLCALAEHNFRQLGLACTVCCANSATYLTTMAHAAVVYIDPARRDDKGARTYDIADCTPNVLELMPLLAEKADRVVLKLSPMLDWRKAVNDLNAASATTLHVHEVHIVSVANECKELVVEMRNDAQMRNDAAALRVVCVDIKSKGGMSVFSYQPGEQGQERQAPVISHFLYEPNASIMKAGCFGEVEQRYGVRQLSANSHLFVSPNEIAGFPGRSFQISAISTMNKRELKSALAGIERANIAVRNFPLSAEQLRRKLGLKDGGEVYIFATTVAGRDCHHLFICRKIG